MHSRSMGGDIANHDASKVQWSYLQTYEGFVSPDAFGLPYTPIYLRRSHLLT